MYRCTDVLIYLPKARAEDALEDGGIFGGCSPAGLAIVIKDGGEDLGTDVAVVVDRMFDNQPFARGLAPHLVKKEIA